MKIRVVVQRKIGPITEGFAVETEGNRSDLAYIEAQMRELSTGDVTALVSPDFMINRVDLPDHLVREVKEWLADEPA